MAKDVITRFKLETTGFDSKIKQSAKELSDYSKTATQAKEGFNQFTKANVDAAKALGTMATSTTNVKDRAKELVGAFNDAAKAYNALSDEQKQSDWAKALSGSLTQLQQRIKETKAEMQSLDDGTKGGGGLFSGMGSKMEGALAVFGGNLMTKAAGAVAQLGSEMVGLVQQGVELAKQGEGIRNAFERLGRGDLLDGLREATHGTVTDVELMKAAVKFDDFKLPLDQLGTMLAFAQQKAKDTGQSVDYMVDSIVTGLGRKSLMILDNLGLSATEIKDKMAETGDMTKAVGAIIREQMAKAGDYVETAADRAAQANVSLQNKMEELGRKFAPVEEASNQLWTSMKISILDVVGGPLARLLNGLTEAGRLKNMLNNLNGGGNGKESNTDKALRILREYSGGGRGIEGKRDLYDRQVSLYNKQEEKAWRQVNNLRKQREAFRMEAMRRGARESDQDTYNDFDRQIAEYKRKAKAWHIMRADYEAGAKQILSPVTNNTPVDAIKTDKPTASTVGKGGKTITEEKDDFKEVEEIVGLLNLQKQKLDDLQAMKPFAETEEEIVRLNKEIEKANTEYQRLYNLGKEKPIEIATGTSIQNDAGMSAYIASIKQQLETADYGTSLYNGLSAQLADMTTLQNLVGESLRLGLGTAMFDAADELGMDFWTRAMEGGVENIDWKTIVDKINEARKAAGLDVISIDFTSGSVNSKDKKEKDGLQDSKTMLNAISQLTSGLQSIGFEIPKEIQSVISVIQGVMQVIEAVNTIIGGGQTAALTANTVAMGALTSALWANTTASWIPFAGGGIVPHFAEGGLIGKAALGMTIPGNSFSGDNLRMPVVGGGMIGLNSGELILNRVQQGVLADALSEPPSSIQGGNPYVSGENIFLGINNYLRRAGYGELVTTKR